MNNAAKKASNKKIDTDELSEKQFYIDFFEHSPNMIAYVNAKSSNIMKCNKTFARKLGYEKSEIIGMSFFNLYPPDCSKKAKRSFKELKNTRRKNNIELRMVKKNGDKLNIFLDISAIHNNKKQVIASRVFIRDITEYSKMQETLHESENKFRTIFENAKDGILTADLISKKFIFANSTICKLTGYSNKELLKLSVFDLHPKMDLPYVLKQFNAQKKGNASLATDIPVLRKDKSVLFCDINSTVVNINDKNYLVGFFRDIAPRKKLETELEHRLKFERIIADISKNIAATPSSKINQSIQYALKALGIFVGIDRSYIFLFSDNKELMSNICEWTSSKTTSLMKKSQEIKRNHFPWFSSTIEKAKTIHIPDVAILPSECQSVKKRWQYLGIKSILVVPLILDGECIGFIGFDSIRKKKMWGASDISLLLTTSEIISEAFARKFADEKRLSDASHLKNVLLQAIQAVAQVVEKRDPYTAGHQRRTALLSTAIAEKLQLQQLDIEGIRLGALIHDIGKICVPTELISRPGELSNIEFELIKTHPKIGHEIICDIDFPWSIGELVLNHHERLNGSGYPNGIKGNNLSMACRILGVADIVEAMTSHRPYRPALGIDIALAEIKKGKNVLYDPKVVDICVQLFKQNEFEF